MVPVRTRVLGALLLVAFLAAAPAASVPAKGKKIPGCAKPKARGGEWPTYSGTRNNHREQLKEKSIKTDNVSDLGVLWQTKTPDGGLIHSTPVVADGCAFFGTELGTVYALNVKTGKVAWKRTLGKTEGSSIAAGAGIVGSRTCVFSSKSTVRPSGVTPRR